MMVSLFLSSPSLTQQPKGSSNLGEVNEQNTYYFGIQEDSPPISKNTWDSVAYCPAFIKVLEKKYNINIKRVAIESKNRFTGKASKGEELDGECGANTITKGRKNEELKKLDGKFSDPFANTGAKVLLRDEKKRDFYSQNFDDHIQLNFGVIQGTTTKNMIQSRYQSFNHKIIFLRDDSEGIQKLENGQIDAYFNDELILNITLQTLKKSEKKYFLSSELFSYEQYGIVVYHTSTDKNNRLLKAINSLLEEAEFQNFGSTQIKILNKPEFNEVIKYLKSLVEQSEKVPGKQYDNGGSISFIRKIFYFFGFLTLIIIIVIVLIIFINNGIHRAKRSRGISPTPTQRKNNSDNRNNEESRVAPLKPEYSPTTPHIIVHNHNNVHSKNDNTQGDNMSERKTEINQNNSSFGVGYSEQIEANQLAANMHNYASEQDLAQAAAKIQALLKQLEVTNPTATQKEKQAFVDLAIPQQEKTRVVRALKAGGEKALEKFLNNPYVDVALAIVKEWQKGHD